MPTTGYIIVSVITSIITTVLLYGLYILLFFPYFQFTQIVSGVAPAVMSASQNLSFITIISNITSGINAIFIILPIGIFLLMYIVGSIYQPTSEGESFGV